MENKVDLKFSKIRNKMLETIKMYEDLKYDCQDQN